jgi:hypothetical protein
MTCVFDEPGGVRISGRPQFWHLCRWRHCGEPPVRESRRQRTSRLRFHVVPGKPMTQTGFGALTYTTSPPTGLLGLGFGGDSSPRMIAVQARIEF